MSGLLARPVQELSGEEFYAFTHSLKWGGGAERERSCTDNEACLGAQPLVTTRVRVDAVDGQDSLTAIFGPATGVVAVRAVNTGANTEAMYHMKADRNFEYYLVVLPNDAKSGKWRLEELDTTPGARRHSQVATGVFKPCNHLFQPGKINRANFFRCDDSHMRDTVQTFSLMLQQKPKSPPPGPSAPRPDPIWVDCEHGCCIAE